MSSDPHGHAEADPTTHGVAASDLDQAIRLAPPCERAFARPHQMKVSALLTRGWIRYLKGKTKCRIGQLDKSFPTVGQFGRHAPDSSKRWFRWARGDGTPTKATTWNGTELVLLTDDAERAVPGSRDILFPSLLEASVPGSRFSSNLVTRVLLRLPVAWTDSFFTFPPILDPDGDSRTDPNKEQIAVLSHYSSIDALAGAVALYREMQLGNRTWECIAANQYLHTLIDNVAKDAWWLGEDAPLLRESIVGVLCISDRKTKRSPHR